jgi:hypothetical protein
LGDFDGIWLVALVGALLISFVGYHYAYQGIFRVEGGPTLPRWQMRAVVAAGFGGFLAHGGGALDQYALQAAGAGENEAKTRVAALGGLEHGVLAIGGCAAAIVVLVSGRGQPPADFTIPWAVIPIPGFLIGFWAADRYRDRFRGRADWRGKLGIFLNSIDIIRVLFRSPAALGSASCGMALFWAADAFATWAGLAAFGVRMNAAELFVGFATGMVFTRRTGPMADAGVLALVLPLTIWVSGAPLAAAVAGVFVYRVLALLMPMPVSLAALPTLRQMAPRPASRAGGTAAVNEPALQPAAGSQGTKDSGRTRRAAAPWALESGQVPVVIPARLIACSQTRTGSSLAGYAACRPPDGSGDNLVSAGHGWLWRDILAVPVAANASGTTMSAAPRT